MDATAAAPPAPPTIAYEPLCIVYGYISCLVWCREKKTMAITINQSTQYDGKEIKKKKENEMERRRRRRKKYATTKHKQRWFSLTAQSHLCMHWQQILTCEMA